MNYIFHYKKRLLTLVLIGIGFASSVYLISTSQLSLWDFRNNLWGPAYLQWNGQSPYNIGVLFPRGNAVWFPPVIGFFGFLGALPQAQASMLWTILNILALLVLIMLAIDYRPSPGRLAFAFMASFLLLPTVTHLRLGQFSLILTLTLLLAAKFLMADHMAGVGSSLALAVTKPQLLILAVPGLVQKVWQHARWRGIWRLMIWSTLFLLLFCLPLFLRYPAWVGDFRRALQQNPAWLQPVLWRLLPGWWGWPGRLIVVGLLLLAFAANVFLWRRLPAYEAMLWSLAMTPLVTPYVWGWDFVLLLPLFLHVLFRIKSRKVLLFLVVSYWLGWAASIGVSLATDNSNHHYWWLSWQLFLIAGIALLWENSQNWGRRCEK